MKKTYAYNHQPITFNFEQTVDRFYVEEIPLYTFTNRGANLILKIKKSNMSTFKLITVLSKATGLEQRDIGYAGLKDKNATTIQYISIPKQYEKEAIKNLTTEKIEIQEKYYSKFPIKIGQLKGNKFAIILHDVSANADQQIRHVAKEIEQNGMPNYFGYQRFGEDSKSYLQGEEIAKSGKRLKGAKEKLLVSAYQSHLFNNWLKHRVEISKTISGNSITEATKHLNYPQELVAVLSKQPQFFKLFLGDILQSYPYGKSHPLQDFDKSSKAFKEKALTATGILSGKKAQRAFSDARHIESEFDDEDLYALNGDRRMAWIYPENLAFSYDEKKQQLRIQFYLPKGAYATTFLEEIAKRSLKPSQSSSTR